MCEECDADVAFTGAHLDRLIESEKAAQHRHKGESTSMHCIRLACVIRDGYLENQGHETLQQLALGFSIAIQRLIVAEQVHGVTP